MIDRVDESHRDMSDMVRIWAAQNSGSYNRKGLAAMRELLKVRFESLGGKIEERVLPPGESISPQGESKAVIYELALQVTVRPEAPVQLVLTGHYDTVFPEDSHFQSVRDVDADTINGPGTADMKGGILVMHHALSVLEQSDKAANVGYKVLLSPDEEIGSPGSNAPLMELGRTADLGLTYEPALADGSLAGARKGSGNFALIVRGRAAHAGREHHLGRNAIAAVAEFTGRLEALNGGRDGVTFNMAKIDGGGAVNIVPDLAIGRFNVRMQNEADMIWIDAQLTELVRELNMKDGIDAELTGGFTRPPKPMAPANAMVFDWVKQAGALLGQDIRWAPSGGVCEGNNLWAAGCPNVDTLGVLGGDIHSDREFMKLSSLVDRARLSAVILLKLASGEFDAKTVKKLALEHQNGRM